MKFLILFALAFVAFADDEVEVLTDVRSEPDGPVYSYKVQLDNGINLEETGSEGSAGQAVAHGSYSYISPEGKEIKVSYTADEGGFQPESDDLPVDHPLPAHAQEQIKAAAEQRAAGVEWDEQGFEV